MDRWITEEDRSLLELSLASDQYHQTTKADFYYKPGTFTKCYSDEQGPVLFIRGAKSLRVDIQFLDNYDYERNRKMLSDNFAAFVNQCKSAGFSELVFNTTSPLLKRFCKQVLKFEVVEGHELRYFIE
jgi:hypothetical protein